MQDGALVGARFDAALHGDSDIPAFAIIGDLRPAGHLTADAADDAGADILPVLSSDDEDTAANELRTMLELGDSSFSFADLLDGGMAADMGDNFVAEARKGIEEVRGDVAALLSLTEAPPGLPGLLTSQWSRVQTQVNRVFGTGEIDLGGRPREDDILDEIDDVLDALSSGPAFAAATIEDGNGVFEDAALSEADALKAFDAAESQATVAFGTTGPTRYGAITATERDTATDDLDYRMGASLGNGDVDDTTTDLVDESEMGLIGAFSYSTIDDVQRVWHVATTGTAYYEGGTRAVSGDGQLFAGDIAIEVRFSTDRVSGLVTNLRSTAGDPWAFQYGEVNSIVLATATNLDSNAHWSTADAAGAAGSARITFAPRAGSPLPQPIRGSFQGQLLGKGATDDPSANGTHAHGTWSVGTQTNSGSVNYLAGGFGAERVGEVGAGPRPGTDDGSVHETVVTSSDGVAEADLTNSFKIDGGNLVVTMNRYGRYLEATADTELQDPDDLLGDGDTTTVRTVLGADDTAPSGSGAVVALAADELFVLDSDLSTSELENVTHELNQSLANMVANAQTDRNVNGPGKQLALVVKELETARGDLAVLQGLNIRNNTAELTAWTKVQAALLRIFHHVPPKLADAYSDDDALGLIDQVLDAFSSSDNLEDALDRDGRGIFNDVTKADGTTLPGAALIWGRQEVQMKTHGGASDYTRWGVWRVRTDRYAARDAWTQPAVGDTNGNEPGSFAYSQLLPTAWADQNDPGFPGSGSAVFMGGTTAIQGTNFLDGDIMVTAEWDSTWDGTDTDQLGELSMRITNLADVDGDPLLDSAGNEFYAIVVSNVSINTNADNQVIFNSTTTGDNTVAFTSLTGVQGLTEGTLTGNTMGKFVGQDIEGPLGVIVTYNFTAAGEFTGAALRGSFGADRP